ncbi:MAG: restriction endonuclease subunit S [Subdoligranulum variabile]|nr:restriction endonuclease subunit S [Subdoligranulum variabile]
MAKQNKPAIRFKGFTDAWEQRKLGALCVEFKSGDFISASDIAENEAYPVYGGNGLRGFTNHYNHDGEYALIGRQGALCGNVNYAVGKSYFTEHAVAVRANKTNQTRFLYYLFSTMNLGQYSGQSAQPGLAVGNLVELENVVPSKPEQEKIASFLSSLDNLITLHQRKYDKLQVLKKAMLEKMFPKNGSSVPEIRFKGFTDAWEQRKLSEIAGKVTEKNTGLQYVETLTNSAEFGIISQRDFFDHDISKLGSLDGYYIVRNEDFVYNPRISTSAPVGPINRNKLGRTGVMSPLYTVFRPHDIDTTYLEHFFKCGYWYSFMNFNGDSGARSDRFSIKDDVFFQMPIPVPHIEEQRKIGLFLTQLDHLITLHQRELEKLQNIKKSMLEKMFV